MRNEIMESIPELLVQAEACADGAMKYEQGTGLKQNRAGDIRTDIYGLVNDRVAYDQAQVALTNLRENRRATIVKSKVFLAIAREIFKSPLGRTWSELWLPTGFTSSLQMPVLYGEIQALLRSVGLFLVNNPTLERKDSNITAIEAKALFDALASGQASINAQRTNVQNLLASRNAKAAQLRKRIRGLANELKQVIDPLDNRWLAFGFNKPGVKQTPDVPTNVTVVLVGPAAAAVNWNRSPRARYYRVWTRNAATEPWRAAGSPADLDFTLEQLLSNSKTEVAVSALNSGGESALSAITAVTTPAQEPGSHEPTR